MNTSNSEELRLALYQFTDRIVSAINSIKGSVASTATNTAKDCCGDDEERRGTKRIREPTPPRIVAATPGNVGATPQDSNEVMKQRLTKLYPSLTSLFNANDDDALFLDDCDSDDEVLYSSKARGEDCIVFGSDTSSDSDEELWQSMGKRVVKKRKLLPASMRDALSCGRDALSMGSSRTSSMSSGTAADWYSVPAQTRNTSILDSLLAHRGDLLRNSGILPPNERESASETASLVQAQPKLPMPSMTASVGPAAPPPPPPPPMMSAAGGGGPPPPPPPMAGMAAFEQKRKQAKEAEEEAHPEGPGAWEWYGEERPNRSPLWKKRWVPGAVAKVGKALNKNQAKSGAALYVDELRAALSNKSMRRKPRIPEQKPKEPEPLGLWDSMLKEVREAVGRKTE